MYRLLRAGPPLIAGVMFLVVASAAGDARADVIFTQNPVMTDANILEWTELSSTTGEGRENGTSNFIIDYMTDVEAFAPAMGQARIEAVQDDMMPGVELFTTVMLIAKAGFGFSVIELNPQRDQSIADGETFVLDALTQFDTYTSGPFDLDNGENRTAAVVVMSTDELITKLTITASAAAIRDIRQVRVSVEPIPEPGPVIPEPGSIVLALTGLAGVVGLRKRLRSAAS